MAATTKGRSSSKNPTSGNDTPNTPDVHESKIARMKVDELRKRLKDRGVKGTAELKKPDLVKKLIKSYVNDSGSKKSTSKGRSSGKNPTSGNDTPNTPDVNESQVARMKVDDLRKELKGRGVKGTAELKKPDLVKRLIKELTAGSKAKKTTAKTEAAATKPKKSTAKADASSTRAKSSTVDVEAAGTKATRANVVRAVKGGGTAKNGAAAKGGGSGKKSTLRTGKATSKSLKYSQEITSPDDKPERAGRSLVTTDHEVIRRWAEERKAVPATVDGTGPGDTLGVLRFDFPGYGGETLRHVDWSEWLETFDKRRLNFIYQQTLSTGKPSNFFQLESPDREDG